MIDSIDSTSSLPTDSASSLPADSTGSPLRKRIFSGVQPSGVLHIGNYLGAIKQWVELQSQADETIYCIVDLHAITVRQKPEKLRKNILSVAAMYLACGIEAKKSTIFVQSSRPEHSELAWILNCHTYMGELSRMTQFKEKAAKQHEGVNAGLFDYPVLMAADILLYQTTHVPVGEDQKQHVELTRDIAERFNNRYGETFVVPNLMMKKEVSRIMGLDDPRAKMSKSASSPANYIALTDEAKTIREKIKRAVTDSGCDIKASAKKPAITNLLNIFAGVTNKSISDLEQEYFGKNYGVLKEQLAEAVIAFLKPIQSKYFKLLKEEKELRQILEDGSNKMAPLAQKSLSEVKKKVGLG